MTTTVLDFTYTNINNQVVEQRLEVYSHSDGSVQIFVNDGIVKTDIILTKSMVPTFVKALTSENKDTRITFPIDGYEQVIIVSNFNHATMIKFLVPEEYGHGHIEANITISSSEVQYLIEAVENVF